jgi:hypothetical protein
MGHADDAVQIGVVDNKTLLGKDPQQNRHENERAGNFDQRKPFSVVTCDGDDSN